MSKKNEVDNDSAPETKESAPSDGYKIPQPVAAPVPAPVPPQKQPKWNPAEPTACQIIIPPLKKDDKPTKCAGKLMLEDVPQPGRRCTICTTFYPLEQPK